MLERFSLATSNEQAKVHVHTLLALGYGIYKDTWADINKDLGMDGYKFLYYGGNTVCRTNNIGKSFSTLEEFLTAHFELNVKPETVELNGKKYLKSELEIALQHLRTVD